MAVLSFSWLLIKPRWAVKAEGLVLIPSAMAASPIQVTENCGGILGSPENVVVANPVLVLSYRRRRAGL
jgi:hypothetical protein